VTGIRKEGRKGDAAKAGGSADKLAASDLAE
jgi:hypothetical protein